MKIQLINPNTSVSMTQVMASTAEQIALPDTQIISFTPTQGVSSIESHFDEAVSALGILEGIKQGKEAKVDGHIIACFGDPNLLAAREAATAPVIGIAEASMHFATLVATRFSIVTTLSRTKIIAEHLLDRYGFTHHCSKVRAIDLSPLALEGDGALKAIYDECVTAKKQDHIGAIVLGCGGMANLAKQLTQELQIPVIDGVSAAVKLVESLVGLGLTTSKFGDLDYPIKKTVIGAFKDLNS